MKFNSHLIVSTTIAIAISACGGGGGGGTAMPAPVLTPTAADPNATVTTATQTVDLHWGPQAAPTILTNTDNVETQMTSTKTAFQFRSISGALSPVTTVSNQLNLSIPLDTSTSLLQEVWITSEVKAAWAQGWTGAGIKIGVLDDFTANDVTEFLILPAPTGCSKTPTDFGTFNNCSTSAKVVLKQTHGDQVAMIAGGGRNTLNGYYTESGRYVITNESGTYSLTADLAVKLSSPQYGIAKDAQVLRNDFLTYQNDTNGLFSVFKAWGTGTDVTSAKYRELKVVNLSLGLTSRNATANQATYTAQLDYANASAVPDAVFVKAAGNSSCSVSGTICDPLNAVLHNAAPFRDKSILVGALTQFGGTLASYSNTAGNYADRFVVADGRGVRGVDGIYAQGTSFAAPRVAGYAAIVRQKFPNLNAAKTSNIILDTASWNSSWGTKSATTQAIYGQGEASLTRALAPVGLLK